MQIKELQELIKFINNSVAKVNVCYACEVIEVKNTRVSVKILANDKKDFLFPTVLDVPVLHLKGGNAQITMPTTAGDIGLIIISSKSTQAFKTGTGTYYKVDFDIDNSFYIGGLFNNTSNEIAIDLTKLTIKKGSNEITLDDSEIVINGGDIKINGGDINFTSTNINAIADLINLGGAGGLGVARIGDTVEVNPTTHQGTITSGSTKVFSL